MASNVSESEKSPSSKESMVSPKRGEKRSAEQVEDEKSNQLSGSVHSANAWEQANLGGDERKQKFLRLMGAGKKQHHGRFVIGDTNKVHTKAEESEKKAKEIEEQYEHSMEHKLVSKRHAGFGFHTEETPEEKNEESSETGKSDGKEKVDDAGHKTAETHDNNKAAEGNNSEGKSEKKDDRLGGLKMSFVKASS